MVDFLQSRRQERIEAALGRYERPLLHLALRITGNIEQARDVVQDTFLKLCLADPGKIDDHLAPWLYTVCRNRALDMRGKEARMTSLNEQEIDRAAGTAVAQADVGEAIMREEARQRVLDLVSNLPAEQREAFHLKFRDGLNYREISGIMGVSLGTVSNLITAALNAIRHEMRSELDLAQEAQS